MTITVTFHGACGIVTGSCFEVRTPRGAVLVDCGMFQGTKTIKSLNYDRFPFAAKDIQAAVVTHAHIDHCGLLPKLVGAGFKGPIVTTPGTADLLAYVLPDSGYIQEIEVERLNRRNRQRGIDPVEPIYTRADAEACLRHVTPRPYDTRIELMAGVSIRFWNAGHILGSASVEMWISNTGKTNDPDALHLLFSGDVGPGGKPFEGDPKAPSDLHHVFMETTYGDRRRRRRTPEERRAILRKEILAGLKKGGMILIPSFAVERTQELLVDFDALFRSGDLPPTPIFVDSPLATRATGVFAKHLNPQFASGSPDNTTHPFERSNLRYVETVDESRKLSRLRSGAIIMAGSGMCEAGRIRHHLKSHLSDQSTTVMMVGYQAPGTLGRLLTEKTRLVRIQGEEIAVAARIRSLDEYSGHADQNDLIGWISNRLPIQGSVFLVHGEDSARDAFAKRLSETDVRREQVHIPVMGETVRLTAGGWKTERIRARADAAATVTDWHNRYAETILTLRQRLDALPTERERQKLLKRVQGSLNRQ